MRKGFADSRQGLTYALACKLTGSWPSEATDRSHMEVMLAASLQARLMSEQSKQFKM